MPARAQPKNPQGKEQKGMSEHAPDEGKEQKAGTDWKAEARKWEDRAKANMAELKSLKETADAGRSAKSELEAAMERLSKLEQENAAKDRALLTTTIANDTGVPADLLVGETREELVAHAEKILAFRGEQPSNPVIPRGGYQPVPPKPNDEQEFVSNLFKRSE